MDVQKMNECINFLNGFFVAEIMAGDYTIKKLDNHYVILITKSGKQFCLWTANDPIHFKPYEGLYNFLDIVFSPEQQKELHSRFRLLYKDEQNRPEEVEKRRKEYERLKAEFENSQS